MHLTAKYLHENDKRVKKTPRTSITIFTTTINTCTCTFFLSDLKKLQLQWLRLYDILYYYITCMSNTSTMLNFFTTVTRIIWKWIKQSIWRVHLMNLSNTDVKAVGLNHFLLNCLLAVVWKDNPIFAYFLSSWWRWVTIKGFCVVRIDSFDDTLTLSSCQKK